MKKLTRRSVIAAVASAVPFYANAKWLHRGGGAGRPTGGGPPPPPPGGTLATLKLVNESASIASAGPTPSFGWIFKKGDIPNAAINAPVFTDAITGAALGYSASVPAMRTYWQDGSLRFCAFSLLPDPTSLVSGNGTRAVTISSGGSWPSMGSGTTGIARTLTADVNPQNLAASMPAAPVSGANLSGTWGAWCDTTGNSANLASQPAMQVVKDMDGRAGTRWRLTFHMSQTKGGTKHGQLLYDFYIMAMSAAGGALAGFRWNGCARQPFYNLAGEGSTAPAKNHRGFAIPNYVTPSLGPNWTATGVSATPLAWRGSDGQPMTSKTCNVTGGMHTTITNNFNFGAPDLQPIPCYFTGSVPTGLDTTSVWYAGFAGTSFSAWGRSDCAQASQSVSGGGTFTIVPIPVCNQFTKITFRDDNGRPLFFQGSGSQAADSTLRVQIDRTYWLNTGLIPPWHYPTYQSAHDGGSVGEVAYGANPWNPISIGRIHKDQSAVGDHQDIGIYPNDAGLDFFNQSLMSERAIRAFANGFNFAPYDFKDATAGSVINLSSITYAGLPAVSSTMYNNMNWHGDPNAANNASFPAPPTYDNIAIGFNDVSNEHRPNYSVWAWLRTGELEYLDAMQNHAVSGMMCIEPYERNPQTPNLSVMNPLGYDVEYRAMGWRFVGVAQAALFGPYDPANPNNTGIDGTQTTKYLLDSALRGTQRIRDIFNPANNYFQGSTGNATAYITGGTTSAFAGTKTLAYWNDFEPLGSFSGGGLWLVNGPEPHYGYIFYGFLYAHLMGDANGTWCMDATAQRWARYGTRYGSGNAASGFWNRYAYYAGWGLPTNNHNGISLNLNDGQVQNTYNSGFSVGTISWTNGQNTFSFSASWIDNFIPENGDIFWINGTGRPELTVPLYIVNYNATTGLFGFATTAGGTAINMTSGAGSAPIPNPVMNGLATRGEDRSLYCNGMNQLSMDWVCQLRQQECWGRAVRILTDGTYTAFDAGIADATHRLQFTPGGAGLWDGSGWRKAEDFTASSQDDVRYLVRNQY